MKSRAHIHVPPDIGAKIADNVADTVGSWRFIIIQSSCLALWVIFNTLAFTYHWDNPPFILLNLMLSFQAAFTGPFVMMAQNRQASRDRLRDDHEADEVDLLYRINQQQLEILQALQKPVPVSHSTEERLERLEHLNLSQMDRLQHLVTQVDKLPKPKPRKEAL